MTQSLTIEKCWRDSKVCPVRAGVAHRAHDAHDAFPQQPRVYIISALASTLRGKRRGERSASLARRPTTSLRAMSPSGPRTVCSTTMGTSGKARVAVPCRLLRRGEQHTAVHFGEERTARRDNRARHPSTATRASPSSTLGHMTTRTPPWLPELQHPACFAGVTGLSTSENGIGGTEEGGVSLWVGSSLEVGVRINRENPRISPLKVLGLGCTVPGAHAGRSSQRCSRRGLGDTPARHHRSRSNPRVHGLPCIQSIFQNYNSQLLCAPDSRIGSLDKGGECCLRDGT